MQAKGQTDLLWGRKPRAQVPHSGAKPFGDPLFKHDTNRIWGRKGKGLDPKTTKWQVVHGSWFCCCSPRGEIPEQSGQLMVQKTEGKERASKTQDMEHGTCLYGEHPPTSWRPGMVRVLTDQTQLECDQRLGVAAQCPSETQDWTSSKTRPLSRRVHFPYLFSH